MAVKDESQTLNASEVLKGVYNSLHERRSGLSVKFARPVAETIGEVAGQFVYDEFSIIGFGDVQFYAITYGENSVKSARCHFVAGLGVFSFPPGYADSAWFSEQLIKQIEHNNKSSRLGDLLLGADTRGNLRGNVNSELSRELDPRVATLVSQFKFYEPAHLQPGQSMPNLEGISYGEGLVVPLAGNIERLLEERSRVVPK